MTAALRSTLQSWHKKRLREPEKNGSFGACAINNKKPSEFFFVVIVKRISNGETAVGP
jgi:hypothetical protein